MSALFVSIEGVKTPIEPANGSDFTLDEAQMLVGGTVQLVPLGPERYMLIHENEKMDAHHQPNPTATMIATVAQAIRPDDYIAGPAVICDAIQFP